MDPYNTAREIRDQLSSGKRRLGFFLGAGCSMAAGLPGISKLTSDIVSSMDNEILSNVISELEQDCNIEDILNRIRMLKEVVLVSSKWTKGDLDPSKLTDLDNEICSKIRDEVKYSNNLDMESYRKFAEWIKHTQADCQTSIEIFTTNYDILLDKSLDIACCPYFDGYIGTVEPYFDLSLVEADTIINDPRYKLPSGIVKLWKMHGSVNWKSVTDKKGIITRILRDNDSNSDKANNLMIFPSRDKYAYSRKLPYLALLDRLKYFLSNGETLLIVSGYSFSDEHINDIILQSLQKNPRLSISAFMYEVDDNVKEFSEKHRNLSIYSENMAILGGFETEWESIDSLEDSILISICSDNKLLLGDFAVLSMYLYDFVGWNQGAYL